MQRESDTTELVLGDGILHVPSESINHPVLLQRINLQFDAAGPEFRFDSGTEKAELHRALLRLVPAIEGRTIAQFDKELEALPVEPLGGETTTGFLRRLVQGLFAADGELFDSSDSERSDTRPTVRRRPVIFVRSRNAGLTSTLDHIVEDLEQDEGPAPEGLARIVGVEAARPAGSVAIRSMRIMRSTLQLMIRISCLASQPTPSNTKLLPGFRKPKRFWCRAARDRQLSCWRNPCKN